MCYLSSLTYGANDASVPYDVWTAEDVQEGHVFHQRGDPASLVLRLSRVALGGLGREHASALALPLVVHAQGRGEGAVEVHGAVLHLWLH